MHTIGSGRDRRQGQAGFSVLEVTIASAIFGVVMALATGAMASGERAAGETVTRHSVSNAVEGALAVMVPELRQSGGPSSGSGIAVDASPEGGAGQRIRFRKNTGFNVGSRQISWSSSVVSYWYQTSGGRLKRQDGSGPVTVLATGIDSNFAFALAGSEVSITIRANRMLPTDGSTVTVEATEKVTLWN